MKFRTYGQGQTPSARFLSRHISFGMVQIKCLNFFEIDIGPFLFVFGIYPFGGGKDKLSFLCGPFILELDIIQQKIYKSNCTLVGRETSVCVAYSPDGNGGRCSILFVHCVLSTGLHLSILCRDGDIGKNNWGE